MTKMRAMVVRERGGALAAQRDIPVPGADEILIHVHACGVCHSDMVTVQKLFPFVQYPRIRGFSVTRPGRRRCARLGSQGVTVNSFDLIGKSAGVRGWYSGMARDSEDTLAFSKLNKVLSMNEIYPLAKAQAPTSAC